MTTPKQEAFLEAVRRRREALQSANIPELQSQSQSYSAAQTQPTAQPETDMWRPPMQLPQQEQPTQPQAPTFDPNQEYEPLPFMDQVALAFKGTPENQLAYLQERYPGEVFQRQGKTYVRGKRDQSLLDSGGVMYRNDAPRQDGPELMTAEPGTLANMLGSAPAGIGSAVGGYYFGRPGSVAGAMVGEAARQGVSAFLSGEESQTIPERMGDIGQVGAETLAFEGLGALGKWAGPKAAITGERMARVNPLTRGRMQQYDNDFVKRITQETSEGIGADKYSAEAAGRHLKDVTSNPLSKIFSGVESQTKANKILGRTNKKELDRWKRDILPEKPELLLPEVLDPAEKRARDAFMKLDGATPELFPLVRKISNPDTPVEEVTRYIADAHPSQIKDYLNFVKIHGKKNSVEEVRSVVINGVFEKAFKGKQNPTVADIAKVLSENRDTIKALKPKYFRQNGAMKVIAGAMENVNKYKKHLDKVVTEKHPTVGADIARGTFLGGPVWLVTQVVLHGGPATKHLLGLAKKDLTKEQTTALVRGMVQTFDSEAAAKAGGDALRKGAELSSDVVNKVGGYVSDFISNMGNED